MSTAVAEKVVVIDGAPCNAETKKPLWGMPKKCWEQEQEIKRLEAFISQGDGKENLDAMLSECRRVVMEELAPEMAELKTLRESINQSPVPEADAKVYPLTDMWPSPPGMDPPMSKTGHQLYYSGTVPECGEFVYFEQMDFYSDSGYNAQTLFDRITKMAGRAIGDVKTDSGLRVRRQRLGPPTVEGGKRVDEYDYSTLPEFKIGNRIEVRVRIVPA